MPTRRPRPLAILSSLLAFALVSPLRAQTTTTATSSPVSALRPFAQANRVAASPDFGPQTRLTGHLPAWVSSGTQAAKAVDNSASLHVSLVLQRDASVQAAFEKLLTDQQTPGSPLYHQWLTPAQVGTLYGPTAADVAKVTSWLTSQGLTVDEVSNSRTLIDVHGTTATVGNAFRTSFAYYDLNGTPRLSATSEPSIPTALTAVIQSIHGLTSLPLHPNSVRSAPQQLPSAPAASANASGLQPNYTNGSSHFLVPADFALIYDINSVYSSGNTGAKLGSGTNRVAIIGQSRVAASDISEYANNTGISGYTLNTIIPSATSDPGPVCTFANANTCPTSGDQGEQTLDVDRVIGTAPGITADLVVASENSGGIELAAKYNVNTLVDPVMTISYGGCEASASANDDAIWSSIYSTGAAEGISTFVSSGDSGVNGCADAFEQTNTTNTASINYLCASIYATCVGGTEFADTANPSLYWSTQNAAGTMESALSYIPEGAWNEPTNCDKGNYCPSGTGGGASIYVARPSWQTGTGVPSGTTRLTPDMAYPAASHDGFYACLDFALGTDSKLTSANNCTASGGGHFYYFGGTSAAAPSMAGVTALLNSKMGKGQGNLNPLLYSLAASTSAAGIFHDVTASTSGVSGCSLTTPSMCNNSTPGSASNSTTAAGGVQGFLVAQGYDEATGLGSIDVANFLTAAAASALTPTTTTITATPANIVLGAASTLKATVASASATGTVQFYADGTAVGSAVALTSGVASYTYVPTLAGTHTVYAVYSGDATYATSTSASVAVVVSNGLFGISAASITPSGYVGVPVTDVVSVTSIAPFAGSVSLASNNSICTISSPVVLTSGSTANSTLTCTPTALGKASVTVTAVSGAATSTVTITLTANSPLSANPSSLSFTSGATTGNTSTITLMSGYASAYAPLSLKCSISSSSAAYQPTCSLSNSSLIGGNTSILTITSTTAVTQSTSKLASLASTWSLTALMLAMAGLLIPAGRRRSLRAIRVLPVLALLGLATATIFGCSSGGNTISEPHTPVTTSSAGTYTVTVTGTNANLATPVTTTVAVTIN